MARRIVNTTYKTRDGWSYRLELWNFDLTASAFPPFVNLMIADPGFTIDWKGSIDDILQPIMSSSMNFSAYLTEYQRQHITLGIFGDSEFGFGIRLYRSTGAQETLEWSGIVHPEETTEEIDDGRILTTFRASDGLASLKNIDFKYTGGSEPVPYSTAGGQQNERSLIYWLKEIVSKLPHFNLLDDHFLFPDGGINTMFVEHRLVRPVNATHNTFPTNDAVLDHYYLKADSFYTRPKPTAERRQGFERKRTERRTNFVSTFDTLSDICASLGATFCFSDGKFHIFDRERVIRGDDDTIGFFNWEKDSNGAFTHSVVFNSSGASVGADLQRVDLDYIGADFLKGATRRGVYPVESVTQTHEGAGSDLILRSGIGYDGPDFETYLYRLSDIDSNTALPAVNFGNVYSNLPPDGIVDNIAVPNGTGDGTFRLHFSGDATYYNGAFGFYTNEFEQSNRGNMAVLRMDVKVNDGSNWYRLRRRVRSLYYTSSGSGSVFTIDVPNSSANYVAKTYEQYQWVKDTDAYYDRSFLEIMIGADPSILTDDNAGETDEFLQDQDFSHVYFTPPLLKQGDSDGELVKDNSRNHYIYRFDEEILMPTTDEGAASTIVKLQIHPILTLYELAHNKVWNSLLDVNGNAAQVVSPSEELAAFNNSSWPLLTSPTLGNANFAKYSENDSILRGFQLSGIEVYLGDGTENYDARYVSSISSPKGSEQVRLKPTAYGATFENSGNRAFGRYRATHPSALSTKEDNLKFHPDGLSGSMAYTDMYVALGYYTTSRALSIRRQTRQSVSGTIIRLNPDTVGADVCRPYKKFSTKKISGSTEYFLPHSLTIQLKDHAQQVEALRCAVEADQPILNEANDDSSRDPNAPPGNGNGGFNPGGGVNHIFQKNNALTTTVAGHTAKLQFITVSSSVDLNNISSGGDSSLFGDLFPIFISKK